MNKYARGSEWRRWDLHVHTPASIVQHYGEDNDETWERYIQDLENLPEQIKVLGINDYLFIDGYKKVKEYKEKGRLKNIDLILPVIEFRIKMFAGIQFGNLKRINLHVIFSENISAETIQNQFLNAMMSKYKLTKDIEWSGVIDRQSLIDLGNKIIDSAPDAEKGQYNSPLIEGFNNLNVSVEDVKQILEGSSYFKDSYLIGIGKTEWDELKWTDSSIAEKKNVIQEADIIFTAAENEQKYYLAKEKLKENNVNYNLLDCSDAHYFSEDSNKDRIGNCMTWIKADPTFEGLKYAIKDTENRIYVGEIPEKEKIVSYNKTKYIKSLSIKKIKQDSKDIWFNNELSFNKDLVAIIGNKGNGKSALADIISYTAEHKDNFSFLNSGKFRNKKSNIANNFESILTWEEDTIINKKNLGEDIDKNKIELVKYIPQSYLEEVCNEISNGNNTKFSEELGKVIFSHIPYEDRLGYHNIEELIENTTISKKNEKYKLIEKLKDINKKIAENTYKISNEYKREIEEKLEIKRNELQSLTKEQPEKVEKPENSEELKTRQEAILKEIDKVNKEKSKLIEEKDKAVNESAKLKIAIQKVQDMIEETNSITSEINEYKSMLERNISDNNLEIKANEIIEIKINKNILEKYLKNIIKQQSEISKKLDINDVNSIINQIQEFDKKIEKLSNTLDEPNKKYKKYELELKNWTDKIEKINGDVSKVDTIRYFENELQKIEKDYEKEIEQLIKQREKILEEIYGKVSEQIEILKKYYKAVQDFIDSNKIVNDNVNLKFNVTISANDFKESFIKYIDMGKTGTYYRNSSRIDEIMEETEFNSLESIKRFTEKILHSLEYNENIKTDEKNEVLNQLRDKERYNELLDYIFSLEYLNVQYELRLGEKPLESLSPGEKGLLLLVFYLLIDKDDCPLIIDQPEENLDNDTITRVLVPCIAEARKKRQIIMVTHNPNLAVVCDAEQIIYCEIQKNNKNKVIYESGSLENPEINKRVTDILEGTMRAFRIRDDRYQ